MTTKRRPDARAATRGRASGSNLTFASRDGFPADSWRASLRRENRHFLFGRAPTTLFAAMNVLDGSVIGRHMQRCRHPDFIHFRNAIEREIPPARRCARSSTTTPPISIPPCGDGSRAIRAGHSPSRRPRRRGSTPSRAFSPPGPSGVSSAASSDPSLTSRPPSIVSLMTTTPSRSPSNGSPIPTKSSPPLDAGAKR